jgi:uncharacterized OsmC-like protein
MNRSRLKMIAVILALAVVFALPVPSVQAAPILQEESPPLATWSATVELSNQFGRSIASARGNTFVIDSVPPLGHPAEEMNPAEAMMGALATCGLFVFEGAAQELDIALTAATVTVQGDFDVSGLTGAADVDPHIQEFRVHFDLEGPDEAQIAALEEQWRLRCPIYTTFIKAAPIVITANDEEMGGPVAEGLATATVTASLSNQPGRAIVNFRDDYLIVDSVPPLGGPNLEVNPLDLLLGAQGACGALIMERVAIDEGISLDGVKGTIEVDFDPRGLRDGSVSPAVQVMRVTWEIGTETHEEAEMLVNTWLERCPIYNTLVRAADIEVSYKLMGEGTALLAISFAYDLSSEELRSELSPLAADFAATEGLQWKIWALDEENSRFTGLLLFTDNAAMQAFLEGGLAAAVMAHPRLSDFEVTPYTIMAPETMITRGPLR